MPRHDFDLRDLQKIPDGVFELTDTANLMVHIRNELRLRQLGPDGLWSRTGIYATTDALIHTWRPEALTELTGFHADVQEDLAIGDRVLFRISADEGVTQLFWDGSVWRTPVDDTEWNTELEVDTGISSFPIQGSLSFSVRLETGTGDSTPKFFALYVWWEAHYDPTEDLLRSIHAKLVEEVNVNGETLLDLDDEDEIELGNDDDAPFWEPAEPIEVFNTDEDPSLRNNLFASLSGTTVTLVGRTAGEILVRYRGRLSGAHVSTDADFEREELPAVVILNLTQGRVRDDLRPSYEEPLRSKGVVRIRTRPARHDYQFQIQCTAQDALHDKKLADAVRRSFDTKEFVRSRALDREFIMTGLEAVNQINRTADQVFMRIVLVTLNVWEWLPSFRDIPMVTKIILRLEPGLEQTEIVAE